MVLFHRIAGRIVSEVPKYQKVFSAVRSLFIYMLRCRFSMRIRWCAQDNEVILDKLKTDRTWFTGVTALVGFSLLNALYGLSLM